MKKSEGKQKQSAEAAMRKYTKTREQLENEIIQFLTEASTKPGTSNKPGCQLKHGLACVLATVKDRVPRATPVDFFNDGLTIWIAGEPGLKIRNIRSNPKVAVGVYHPVDHSKLNRSLQIQGTATLFNVIKQRDEFMRRVIMFGIYDAVNKILSEKFSTVKASKEKIEEEVMKVLKRFNLIRIEPDEITYLSIHPTAGTEKDTWKKAQR